MLIDEVNQSALERGREGGGERGKYKLVIV